MRRPAQRLLRAPAIERQHSTPAPTRAESTGERTTSVFDTRAQRRLSALDQDSEVRRVSLDEIRRGGG